MVNWKDCITPIGLGALAPPAPPPKRKRRVARKCSICTNNSCTVRGTVVNWLHCSEHLPEGTTKDGK